MTLPSLLLLRVQLRLPEGVGKGIFSLLSPLLQDSVLLVKLQVLQAFLVNEYYDFKASVEKQF